MARPQYNLFTKDSFDALNAVVTREVAECEGGVGIWFATPKDDEVQETEENMVHYLDHLIGRIAHAFPKEYVCGFNSNAEGDRFSMSPRLREYVEHVAYDASCPLDTFLPFLQHAYYIHLASNAAQNLREAFLAGETALFLQEARNED